MPNLTNKLFNLDNQILTPLSQIIPFNYDPQANRGGGVDHVNAPQNDAQEGKIGRYNPSNPYGNGLFDPITAAIAFADRIRKDVPSGDIASTVIQYGLLYSMNPLPHQIINPLMPFLGPLAQPVRDANTLDGIAGRDYETRAAPTEGGLGRPHIGNVIDQVSRNEDDSFLKPGHFERRRSPAEITTEWTKGQLNRFIGLFHGSDILGGVDQESEQQWTNAADSSTHPQSIGKYGGSPIRYTKKVFEDAQKRGGFKDNIRRPGEVNQVFAPESKLIVDKFYDEEGWQLSSWNNYMPFEVTDLRRGDGENTIYLRAFLTSLTEGYSPEWNQVPIYGRAEHFAHWKACVRKWNVALKLAAFSSEEIKVMYKKLNFLARLNYAKFSNGKPVQPPLCRIRIGDLIKTTVAGEGSGDSTGNGLPGYLDGLNIDYMSDQQTWEIEPGSKVPKLFTINFSMTVLHDTMVDSDTNFYDVDKIGANLNEIYSELE